MAINGVGHNYDYFGTTTNYIRGRTDTEVRMSEGCRRRHQPYARTSEKMGNS